MPRGGGRRHSGGRGRYSDGGGAMVTVNGILTREATYRAGIKENFTRSCMLAESLAVDGPVEKCMLQAVQGMDQDNSQDEDDIQSFLQEQRNRIKTLAGRYVESQRSVDAFMESIRQVVPDIQKELQSQDDHGTNNYEELIRSRMRDVEESQQENRLNLEEEKEYREICNRLGEKPASQAQESDEELQVIQEDATQTQAASLKCPVTCVLYKEPVKNKTCGHVYSREGIMQIIRLNKQCPVPGCPNGRVALGQLEDDTEMEMKVRRFVRREAKQRQLSQANQDDSDEEVL